MSPITILVVDDEVMIAELIQQALEDAGFAVIAANDGDWATAILDDPTQTIAALVTDINMGHGPDGWAVGRRAREAKPTMPVVYMTGMAGNEWPVRRPVQYPRAQTVRHQSNRHRARDLAQQRQLTRLAPRRRFA